MYKISEFPQRTPEWYLERLGLWTASFFCKAITPTGKRSVSSQEINNRLVAERILGEPDETFQSDAMLRGKELEDEALEFLNFTHGYNFQTCGFIRSTEYDFGCSADAIDLEHQIGLEMKCPSLHTHIEYISSGELPKEYKAQVQGGMMVTGFKRWVFMSYHPDVRPLVIIVERDEEYIAAMKAILIECCKEVKEKFKTVTEFINE
jgi:putative phage-type endonuclease